MYIKPIVNSAKRVTTLEIVVGDDVKNADLNDVVLSLEFIDKMCGALKENERSIIPSYYRRVDACCTNGPARHHLACTTGWTVGSEERIGQLCVIVSV